jgi:hypothetical protein
MSRRNQVGWVVSHQLTRLRAGSMFVGLGKLLWAKKVPVAQYVVGPGH